MELARGEPNRGRNDNDVAHGLNEPRPWQPSLLHRADSIALLSNELEPLNSPSPSWLGRHSPREEIRRSGLWNLDYVWERYDPDCFGVLEELAGDTLGAAPDSPR